MTAQPADNAVPGRKWRRRLLKLAFALVVALVALKVGDVAVGRFHHTAQRHWMRLTPNAAIRHRSTEFDYVFHTNAHGFRGPDVPFKKPAGTKRIVVLGDSFVAGLGVRDDAVFTVPLQALLRDGGQSVEVVNVGRAGSSTISERNLYTNFGRKFQPDIVILVFFVGNDLTEIMEEWTDEELRSWKPPGLIRGWSYTLFPNLYLELAMMRRAESADGERRRSEEELAQEVRNEATRRGQSPDMATRRLQSIPAEVKAAVCSGEFPLVRLMHACLDPERQRRSLEPDDEFFRLAWPRVQSQLEQLKSDVSQDAAELRVVLLPASVQVDPQAIRFNRRLGFAVDKTWLTGECRTERALQNWCSRNNIPALNLVTEFRAANRPLYHIWDSHLNTDGHAVTAHRLARWLTSNPAR